MTPHTPEQRILLAASISVLIPCLWWLGVMIREFRKG